MEFPRESIQLKKIHFDTANARHGTLEVESEVLKWMLTDYRTKDKTFKLAKAIAEVGLSPIDEFLVVPMDDTDDDYVVVEGNRRITALKLLNNPELAPTEVMIRRYQQLVKEAKVQIPKVVECKIAPGFQEASYWIRLRHGGEQEGIGIVPWGSKELERFNLRVGRRGPNAKAIEVLDYAYENQLLNADQIRLFPLTNLTRLLNDPTVRGKMGIETTADGFNSTIQEGAFKKGLGTLLREIADGDVTVTNIKQKDQRRSYIDGVMRKAGVGLEKKAPKAYEIKGSKPFYATSGGAPQPRRQGRRPSHHRNTLIPKNVKLSFSIKRLNDVFLELQYLKVEEYPNSAAVLFRVFFEGCIDRYADKQKISGYKRDGDALRDRARKVIEHLKQTGRITKNTADPVAVYLTSDGVGSIRSFNSYIHNISHTPIAKDLKTAWDNLAPFFDALNGHI